jgi:hypothetical protein
MLLVTAAIVLRNTVHLKRATQASRESGKLADNDMLQFLSPLGQIQAAGAAPLLLEGPGRIAMPISRNCCRLGARVCPPIASAHKDSYRSG